MIGKKKSDMAEHIRDCVHDGRKIMGDIRFSAARDSEYVQAANTLDLDEGMSSLSMRDRGRIVGAVYLNRLDVDNE